MTSNFGYMPQAPSFMSSSGPWFAPYGDRVYGNFGYPGVMLPAMGPYNSGMMPYSYNAAMTGYSPGIYGGAYPGGGQAMMMKPNIYLSGKPGTQVKVKLNFPSSSYWLIAVPFHGKNGWDVKLAQEDRVQSEGAEYRFLYYDYRSDLGPMQNQAGFCTNREQLIPRLLTILKEAKFQEAAIQDFQSHWSVKIPPSKRYCVFPQDQSQIEKLAPLEVIPRPKTVTRLLFVVVMDAGKKLAEKFSQDPPQAWKFAPQEASSQPANSVLTDDFQVREWGVAFLAEKP
jgi:hypothetical protein